MKIHLNDEEIALYTDAFLEQNLGKVDRRIVEHVAECRECKSEILALSNSMKEYETYRNSKGRKWYLEAFLIAATILIISSVYLLRPTDNDGFIAESFKENDFNETLVGQKLRDRGFSNLTPKINEVITSDTLRFKWKASENKLIFTIENNSGNTVFKKNITGNSLSLKNKYTAGLYYWKLETSEYLLFVGKFRVNN